MRSNPDVSVIIPFYNAEKYIARCIVSIQQQTFKKIEVLLISDQSTDGTDEVIDLYASADNRLRVINNVGHGISDGRNTGIKNAHGKFILFVDADDWIESTMIEKLYNKMQAEQSEVCYVNFNVVDESGKLTQSKIKESKFPAVSKSGRRALKLLFSGKVFHYPWNMMSERKLFIDNNIEYPSGRNYEDFSTTYKLLYYAQKVSFIDQKLYFYVQHTGSITHKIRGLDATDIMDAIDEMDNFFDGLGDSLKKINVKYQIPRLYLAYRISCISDMKSSGYIRSEIINKTKQEKLFKSWGFKDKIKYVLLSTGGLRVFFKIFKLNYSK